MSDTKLSKALASPRTRALALCGALVASLFGVAAFVPLPYTVTWPGSTADVLGTYEGKPVLTITGAPVRTTEGELRMVTITATNADQKNTFLRSMQAWFDPKEAIRPTDTVYPESSPGKADEVIAQQMAESQDNATAAALDYLHLSPSQVKVKIDLGAIGGPSAGQMLALGIVDKLSGDGNGGDLTGGLAIAGTGTIEKDGTVGPVGGVPLKTQAAARDGATVFLLPKDECSDAKVNLPKTLRLVPVGTLAESVSALKALKSGGSVPAC